MHKERIGTMLIQTRRKQSLTLGGIGLALMALSATPAFSQLTSTTDLRNACQTSPGNVVVLTQPASILVGPRYPATEQVLTGCTIVIGPGAKLDTEGVSMTFAGPLVVQSANLTEVKLTRTYLSAPSANFNLTGTGTAIEMSFSLIRTTAGSLSLTMGDESKLTVMSRLVSGPLESLIAATTLQIQGGQKYTAAFGESTRFSAPQGINIAMNGAESSLSITTAWLTADQGNVTIASSAAKGVVNLSSTNLVFKNLGSIRLAGSDSLLKLEQNGMSSAISGQVAPGGMTIEVGAGAAENSVIQASNVAIFDVASITVRASAQGQKGVLAIQKSHLRSTGDIVLETGAQGLTEVKESYGASSTRLRAATGAGGSCLYDLNTITAPIMQICP
jgi:hypothetical protein